MIGAQDLGGAMGFGPVVREDAEPVFHAKWEAGAFALTMAAGFLGFWNIDGGRHARESLPPADYLASSYYKIWFEALEKLLLSSGLVSAEEIAKGRALAPSLPVKRVLNGTEVAPVLAKGFPYDRPMAKPALFKVGDGVRTKLMYKQGHTRLPRYVFGKCGVVDAVRGGFVFPDEAADGRGEQPQWLYTIRFTGRELWGEAAGEDTSVSIDAWESYLGELS
jgi:nitrile hydratase beta subunit